MILFIHKWKVPFSPTEKDQVYNKNSAKSPYVSINYYVIPLNLNLQTNLLFYYIFNNCLSIVQTQQSFVFNLYICWCRVHSTKLTSHCISEQTWSENPDQRTITSWGISSWMLQNSELRNWFIWPINMLQRLFRVAPCVQRLHRVALCVHFVLCVWFLHWWVINKGNGTLAYLYIL